MRKIKMYIVRVVGKLGRILRLRWRSIAYYGCVVVVLCAVAYAAEAYRKDEAASEMVLPAVEIAEPVREVAPEIATPEGVELIREYSGEPGWNEALRQWECHQAQDYIARNGEIPAFCGGVVSVVGKDSRTGNFVETVSGDLVLKYCSVSAAEGLEAGMEIEAGESIGSADGSMLREGHQQPYLHLEAYYKGENTDISRFRSSADGASANS